MAEHCDDVRALLDRVLRAMGHVVVTTRNVCEALALLGRQYFDLIVTAALLPDGPGSMVIKEANRRHPSARVLALCGGAPSSQGTRREDQAARDLAHAAIEKPFGETEFRAALAALLASLAPPPPFPPGAEPATGAGAGG